MLRTAVVGSVQRPLSRARRGQQKKRGDRNKNGHGGKLQSSDVLWRGHYPAYCRYFVHHGLCCCDDAQNLPPPTGLVLVRTNKTSQRLGSNWDETAACLRANKSFGVGVFGVRVRVRTRFSARRRRDPLFTSRLRKVIPGGVTGKTHLEDAVCWAY